MKIKKCKTTVTFTEEEVQVLKKVKEIADTLGDLLTDEDGKIGPYNDDDFDDVYLLIDDVLALIYREVDNTIEVYKEK